LNFFEKGINYEGGYHHRQKRFVKRLGGDVQFLLPGGIELCFTNLQ
jgi:hypothetical protein